MRAPFMVAWLGLGLGIGLGLGFGFGFGFGFGLGLGLANHGRRRLEDEVLPPL